jgi:long-subunit acyl-CoA synthetase (AMP-forming)
MGYLTSTSPPRGEICIRGPAVTCGYYKDVARTKEDIEENGWFHTGDVGEWTECGTLRVIDRKKNIFKLAQGEVCFVLFIDFNITPFILSLFFSSFFFFFIFFFFIFSFFIFHILFFFYFFSPILSSPSGILYLTPYQYIAAERIELLLSNSRFVGQVWVYGDSFRDCCVCFVTLNRFHFPEYEKKVS